MATLKINAPIDEVARYLEEVQRQIGDGFTSGHVDRDTHWDIDLDDGESIDDRAHS